jgi:hypothetical protein
MLIDDVRAWLLDKWGLPPNACIYPPQQINGVRPDLVVVGEDGAVLTWVEIELGGENAEQMAVYRDVLDAPVRSIVGSVAASGDLHLQDITSFATTLRLTTQQQANVRVFTQLVDELAGRTVNFDYIVPNEALLEAPLLAVILPHLQDILVLGVPPVRPGQVMVSTVTNKGWTLRVFSLQAQMRSTTLLWDQTPGRGIVRIPARDKLEKYLAGDLAAVSGYCDFLRHKGADVDSVSGTQSLPLAESILCNDAEALATHVRRLASIYGTLSD